MAITVQTIGKKGQDVTVLRGLDARIQWASVGTFANAESTFSELGGARLSARFQGMTDFQRGRESKDVPPLLAEVADLAEAWSDGWSYAEALDIAAVAI